ncbi:hypothetical protein [Cellvibrio sp. UBA7671]|uniref:hypothetical protein n=1 Tax=Cellvibrio sp. UBA7671 TaxID=1946312 RepID=UPI002F34FD66
MSNGQTKNSALKTALAFHYQVLIGLDQCFSLKEGQSIWFERDGDVSLLCDSMEESKQVEVKNYSDSLGDHHENLWNTLKNWLAPEFQHHLYSALVLHTTQKFGSTSTLKNWNQQDAEERFNILNAIFATRTQEDLTAEKPKPIVVLQKFVMEADPIHLKSVLAKVVLFTESDDEKALRDKLLSNPIGIPNSNKEAYLQGLVGFVYDEAHSHAWEVKKEQFAAKCEELTSTYCKKEYTFPTFEGYEATKEQISTYQDSLFVKKIVEIDHHDVIPDAIGNWLELNNSLNKELDEYPLFRKKTDEYQKKLIKRFKLSHSTAKLSCTHPVRDSKLFYNQIINEIPLNIESDIPPIEYKNGLIHDAMDTEEQDLRWKVEP